MNQFSEVRDVGEIERDDQLGDYYREAQSWSADRERAIASSRKTAWIVAGVLGVIALLEAIALVVLLPLKTVEPYALLVDRQTGYIQALDPLEGESIRPSEAMERSFLAQYVIAREGFDIDTLQEDYRKVALWSAGDARSRYVAEVQASNPASKLATLGRQTRVEVEVRSISSINAETAMVRYVTIQTDPGGQRSPPQPWVAILRYRFSGEAMSAEDRLVNPLGFQVVRYRQNAELIDEPQAIPALENDAAGAPERAIVLEPRTVRVPQAEAEGEQR